MISIAMPFVYFASNIEEGVNARQLHEIYIDLHDRACAASGKLIALASGELNSPISYNLGLTSRAIVICPRTCEGTTIECNDGERVGPVSLNGTVLGGTILVKSEPEWDSLRSNDSKLIEVLSSIGINSSDKKPGGKI